MKIARVYRNIHYISILIVACLHRICKALLMFSLVEYSAFGVSLRFGYFLFLGRSRSVKRLFFVFLTVFVNFLHQLFFVYLGSLRHCLLYHLFYIGVCLNVCSVYEYLLRR